MHILYLHQFFTTREGTGGTRSYEFARHLARAGHDVTMVTAARGETPRRYDVDGIAVVEVKGGSPDYVRATATVLRPPDRRLRRASRPRATAASVRAAPPRRGVRHVARR